MRSQWEPAVMPGEDPAYLDLPKSYVTTTHNLSSAWWQIHRYCLPKHPGWAIVESKHLLLACDHGSHLSRLLTNVL